MPEQITLQKLKQYLDFFHKMYDVVRLVDPERKRVLEYRSGGAKETAQICYAYWRKGEICDNCISMRAHREKRTFVKLEQTPRVVMLVTAMPVESAEKPVVLEMLRNATDTMFVGSGEYAKGQPLDSVMKNLNAMVVTDELTQVYNRRFVDERLPAEVVRSKIGRQPLTVIFADIDNLKRINDIYGHAAGDTVIRAVGEAMRQSVRTEKDWVARYGGDEFLICLNHSAEKGAEQVVRRILENIGGISFSADSGTFHVSLSFGVQSVDNGENLTAEDMLRLADRKMYEMKRRRKDGPDKGEQRAEDDKNG